MLQVLHKIRGLWAKLEEDGAKTCRVKPPQTELLAKVREGVDIPPDMASFPATQEDGKPELDASSSRIEALIAKQGKSLEKELSIGYGSDGETVQLPESFLSDREIMRRTVLRGKSKVAFPDLSLRKVETYEDAQGVEKKRKISVPQATWEQVVQAALKKYPIGKVIKSDSGKTTVHFAEPPTEPRERIPFHNALVNCCQITLRQFGDALDKESASKKRKQDGKPPPTENTGETPEE